MAYHFVDISVVDGGGYVWFTGQIRRGTETVLFSYYITSGDERNGSRITKCSLERLEQIYFVGHVGHTK